jgi:hypothetical protein
MDGGGASGGHGAAAPAGEVHAGNGEDGAPGHATAAHHHHGGQATHHNGDASSREDSFPASPRRRTATPNPFSRKNTSIDLDAYFVRGSIL